LSQTDFQRLKYFVDDARVIDLHGLNTAWIAHRPRTEPVRYGKFRHELGLEVRAEVWVYGHRLGSHHVPMAVVPMAALLADPAAYERFVGYGAPAHVHDAMAAAYLPASIAECGAYFNFLVRRDLGERFVHAGVLVGDGHGRLLRPP
jgi:hypothetical protein